MASRPLTSREQSVIDAVSSDELMASTNAIARWVRLSGTPEEVEAFDWIESTLASYGLDTTRHEHPALVSWPESASLTIRTGDGETIEIPCSTHAFARNTPPGGLSGALVAVGRGSDGELANADVIGRIVLVEGIIAPNRNLSVEAAGVAGSIWIAGTHLHERALSPVWGTPTPETAHLLPKTPSISVNAEHGARITEALERGSVEVTIETSVYQGWRQLPLVIADLWSGHPSADDHFVLLSGHVDSWYYGVMDNGTANATMLEVGRVLAGHRDALRRGLRLAFWSGHSHARYAGSAWYADHAWQDLHDCCVAHINVDSVGGTGATILSQGNSMEELRGFVSDAIEPIAGQRLEPRRYGRSGDQSFWGHGIPAALMSLSEQPPENADPVLLALHQQISGGASKSGGLGWWWHLPDDTVDKIDPEFLRRDASIYALLLYRLCTIPILPLDYRPVVAQLQQNVEAIASRAGEHLGLESVFTEINALTSALERFYGSLRSGDDETSSSERVNDALMRIGRALIPVDYSTSGEFDHDLAVPTQPIPGLQAATTLQGMDPDSDDYQFLRTRLVRERNRLVHGIIEARRAVEGVLA